MTCRPTRLNEFSSAFTKVKTESMFNISGGMGSRDKMSSDFRKKSRPTRISAATIKATLDERGQIELPNGAIIRRDTRLPDTPPANPWDEVLPNGDRPA